MEGLNDSEVNWGNWSGFRGNATGVEDYFVPTWIIAFYVFFLSVGVCFNVMIALVLLCSRKNGNFGFSLSFF